MIATRQKIGSRWRANCAHIEILKRGALSDQRIDFRRREVGVSINAEIPPALIIRQEDDNVRLLSSGSGYREANRNNQAQQLLHLNFLLE